MAESPALESIGWTPARALAFEPWRREGLVPGRVSLEHNHVYRVLTETGEHLAEAAGRLKHDTAERMALPVVGDWVALRVDAGGARGQIKHVLPRTSVFVRKSAGDRGRRDGIAVAQAVAANIDTVFVVFALDERFRLRAIERYLVVARQSGAAPVVVLNKADLAEDAGAMAALVRQAAGDAPVLLVSARRGDGLDALTEYLGPGATAALIGPSGVGKSSLVNRLVGADLLPTGDVRAWDARGRHTSVHRQLVRAEAGGLLIDTPGMRELQLWETDGVEDAFADVAALAPACKFRDCKHDAEPGCAVKAAVEQGSLTAARHEHFLQLRAEQEAIERLRDQRAQDPRKRQTKIQHRALRSLQQMRSRQGR